MVRGQNGVKKNTKERSAKNACKHDQADDKGVHNVSPLLRGLGVCTHMALLQYQISTSLSYWTKVQ